MQDNLGQGTPNSTGSGDPRLELLASPQLASWLADHEVSLAFTTYQAGKLFLVGLQADGRLSLFERTFNRCMGLCASPDAQTLYMSTLYQLWRFENALEDGQMQDGYDGLYIPQVAYTTGELDIHDIALTNNGRPIFVNTLFSCLGTVSERHSFAPVWRPPFISSLAPEDRCHLNGLTMDTGKPRYVTSISQTDTASGWRARRRTGGVVVDVQTNVIVADGLSMPHSPRLYRNTLWVLNSGTGYLGYVDLDQGRFTPVTFCPGYLRGLAFAGDFAIVGLSQPRENRTFDDLPLEDELRTRRVETQCAVQVIDLQSGKAVHWLRLEGVVKELYDVVALPKIRRPMALGFKTDEIRRTVTVAPPERIRD